MPQRFKGRVLVIIDNVIAERFKEQQTLETKQGQP